MPLGWTEEQTAVSASCVQFRGAHAKCQDALILSLAYTPPPVDQAQDLCSTIVAVMSLDPTPSRVAKRGPDPAR